MAKNNNFLFKLDILILSVLKNGDYYGYEMIKTISNATNGLIVPKHGTMYPIFYDLLNQGYISSYDKTVDRKVRVYYHLEEKGQIYLDKLVKEYDMLVNEINQIVHN